MGAAGFSDLHCVIPGEPRKGFPPAANIHALLQVVSVKNQQRRAFRAIAVSDKSLAMRTILLSLWLLLATSPALADPALRGTSRTPAGSVDVIFDMSMDPVATPFEVAFEGMSRLLALLRRHGASVSSNVLPLETVLGAWGGPGRVLVLGMPWKTRYSPAALDAIDAFMRAGGGVLVITEHDNVYLHADAQNELTRRYGIETVDGHSREAPRAGDPVQGYWPFVAAPDWGISRARFLLPAPLAVRLPAKALAAITTPARSEWATVMAEAAVGQGRLLVVADSEWLWDMTREFGLRGDDNEKLALRMFGELAGRAGPLVAEPAPRPAATMHGDFSDGTRCVAFESDGNAFALEEAPNGLMTLVRGLHAAGFAIRLTTDREAARCEASLLILPLLPLGEAVTRLKGRRLILVTDGDSDSTGYAGSMWKQLPIRYDEYEGRGAERPLDALTSSLGLHIPRVTLIDENDTTRVTALAPSGGSVVLHRAGTLSWKGHAFRGLVAAVPGTRKSDDLFPVTRSVNGKAEFPRRRTLPASEEPLWVVAQSDRVFAVADLELVTDQVLATDAGKELLKLLIDWLVAK